MSAGLAWVARAETVVRDSELFVIGPRLWRFLIALLVVPAIQLLSAAFLPAHGADAADVAPPFYPSVC